MDQLIKKIYGSALLKESVFKEAGADPDSMSQALVVLLLSSAAFGIASFIRQGPAGLIGGALGSFIDWVIWIYMVYILATRVVPGSRKTVSISESFRALAFAGSPGLIRVLGVVPQLYLSVNLAAGIWMVAAMALAIKSVFEYEDTWKAVGVCVAGWLMMLIAALVLGSAVKGLGF